MENRDLTREEQKEKEELLRKAKELAGLVANYNHINSSIFEFLVLNKDKINSAEFVNILTSYRESLSSEIERFDELYSDSVKESVLDTEKSNSHKK